MSQIGDTVAGLDYLTGLSQICLCISGFKILTAFTAGQFRIKSSCNVCTGNRIIDRTLKLGCNYL